nr:hypothetical protein [Tanacetum cinerariifolium]
MVGGNGGNQFRQYDGQNVRNLNGYNNIQNVMNQVIQHAVQNPGIHNVVQGNGNQNPNGNGNLVAARSEGNAAGQNGNQIRCYNCRGVGHFARNCTNRPRRRDATYLQTQLLIAQKEEAGIQLQAEEFDLMAATANLDEIKEVNANYILMANLQQASTSGTQTDKALVYDSDRSAEVHNYENCYDNEIFNMFTQEEQYTELLEPIPEPHQVLQNDNNIISMDSSVEQSGETVEQHPVNFEETRTLYDSLYKNLAIEVEKVNTVNRKLLETNADLTTELARFKNQEKCFEIKKKKLKSDFKIREDELFDKQIQLEKKIKDLNNILVKTGQSIQTIHMLSPKPDSFYHTEQKMALAKFVGDFKSLAKEADESLAKHKALELEIECLLRAVVSQDIMFVVQKASVVDTSDLQTELEHTKERFENSYKDMQQKIEQLQAQLGDLKGKSKDTSCVSDTLNPLSQKLENENVELEFQDNTRGTSTNTKFAKQSILGKPPMVGMFRINHFKTYREEKHVPNNVRASAKTKPITVSQPSVFTKKDMNSDSNGLSSTGIDNTKTRRP